MATVFSGAMRAGGTVWMPLLISIVAIAADRSTRPRSCSAAPSASKGVWIAYPVTFATMFVLQMAYYGLVWRKRTIERLI